MNWPGFRRALLLCTCVFASSSALAEFDAGITLGVSQADNIFLDPPGEEQEDIYSHIAPFLTWTKESPTLDGLFDYRYDRYDYKDAEIDQSWHFLNSSLTGKALDEALRLQVGASRRQVLQNPNQDILPGRAPLTGNLVDLDQWYVAPGFEQVLGGSTTLSLNYRYTESKYDQGDLQGDNTQDAQFNLNNYVAGQGFTWGLKYNYIQTEYDTALPFEYQNAGADLGFWTGTNLRLFAGGGLESEWDNLEDRSPQDPYWEAGFAYQSGQNLSAEFAAGERSFGDSLRGSLNFEFQRGSTSLSYTQQPTTEGFNRRRGGNPISPEDPDDFLTNPGVAERYVSERFNWDLTVDGRRSQLRLSVFAEQRTGRFAADGSELPDQDQQGLTASFSWQAGVRTQFVLNGSVVNRDLDEQTQDDFIRGSVAINYDLGTRTTLSLSQQYTDQDPGDTGATRGYTLNVTSLFVTFTLR